jgi:hypothetical protein
VLDAEYYIEVPPVYQQYRLTVENAEEIAQLLKTRRISQEPGVVDETGVSWHHIMTGAARINFGQYLVIMRDGFAAVYTDSLETTVNHQKVNVGGTGRVSLDTTPI